MSTAPFTPAWLAGAPEALHLLPRSFDDPARRRAIVARAAQRRADPAVIAAIRTVHPAQEASREALARPGAVCVVTGQQAGLFGGPLYTVYKAAAAIVDARALQAETGAPCVPVFWLQNEDHDYDEIASCAVLAGGDLRHVAVPGRPGEAGCSISARALGPEVDEALAAIDDALHGLSEADEAMALLRRCWQAGRSPCAAFRDWIEALFARHGLLVLDPSDPALVEAARPVHRRALVEAQRFSDALLARSAALEAAGFAVQVHVRPGAPLSFHHPDGPRGPRRRVDGPVEGGHFSTSALLRPILQDTWLPTAAYVGGPGEIAYFAQLPPLYEAFGLPMPIVAPRARFRVLDDAARRLLDQLGLDADALSAPRDALLRDIGRPRDGHPDPDVLERALLEPIRAALEGFLPHAEALDPGLRKAADKTLGSLTDNASRLVDRYRRTLAQRDEVTVQRLDRALARLQPGGAPQERVHCWPWYGARFGVEGFVDLVLDAVAPFDGALKELRP